MTSIILKSFQKTTSYSVAAAVFCIQENVGLFQCGIRRQRLSGESSCYVSVGGTSLNFHPDKLASCSEDKI